MKQNFNFHTHTARCGHAFGTDEQYVKAAIKAGFHSLGFSDHMAYPGIIAPGDRMRVDQINEYLESIEQLKQQYIGQIKIYKGFEMEWFDTHHEYYEDIRKQCDYLILGQHLKYVDGYEYEDLCDDEDLHTYVMQIEAGMASGLVSYLAHPDYFMQGRRDFSEVCINASKRICEASITYQVPLEINLKGLMQKSNLYDDGLLVAYPYRRFWEIASAYGCEVIYGFDAHRPVDLLEAKRIEKAETILAGLKFNFISKLHLK